MAFQNVEPLIILSANRIVGILMSYTWLTKSKNIDFVEEFGADPGSWQSLSGDVEDTRINDTLMNLRQKID